MPKLNIYHQNFIKGVRIIMANRNIETTKEVAAYIGINYMSLWKIMDGSRHPTIENCIKLLKKGKFNANWLFLNTGEMYMQQQTSIDNIITELQSIHKHLSRRH